MCNTCMSNLDVFFEAALIEEAHVVELTLPVVYAKEPDHFPNLPFIADA